MAKNIRIALADDHPILRDGLRLLLDLEPDFEVVAEAEDGTDVTDLLKKHEPDILLLDLMMPRLDGLSVLQRIPSCNLKTKSIVLTATEDPKAYVLSDEVWRLGHSREEQIQGVSCGGYPPGPEWRDLRRR